MRKHADSEHDFGLVKIGITSGDLLRRVAQLQTGNPYDLLCFDSFDTPWPRQVEHYMHRTHADDMQQPEWLRCRRQELEALVGEARAAAKQIEQRKERELQFLSCKSNGVTRRATPAEFELHHKCRKIMRELVPAELRLTAVGCRLRAATGDTLGIPGIVTVRYEPATIRFSADVAAAKFPELARRCVVERIDGVFRWRNVPRPSHYPEERRVAREQQLLAKAAAEAVLLTDTRPNGWIERNSTMEEWHEEFLQATRTVHGLQADLDNLQTELILQLGEHEALDPVCSFKRDLIGKIDRATFCKTYQAEAEQCAEYVAPRLTKNVYTSRSYV